MDGAWASGSSSTDDPHAVRHARAAVEHAAPIPAPRPRPCPSRRRGPTRGCRAAATARRSSATRSASPSGWRTARRGVGFALHRQGAFRRARRAARRGRDTLRGRRDRHDVRRLVPPRAYGNKHGWRCAPWARRARPRSTSSATGSGSTARRHRHPAGAPRRRASTTASARSTRWSTRARAGWSELVARRARRAHGRGARPLLQERAQRPARDAASELARGARRHRLLRVPPPAGRGAAGRGGTAPRGLRGRLRGVLAEAHRLGIDVLSLETNVLPPPAETDVAALRDRAAPAELVLAHGHPQGLRFGARRAAGGRPAGVDHGRPDAGCRWCGWSSAAPGRASTSRAPASFRACSPRCGRRSRWRRSAGSRWPWRTTPI